MKLTLVALIISLSILFLAGAVVSDLQPDIFAQTHSVNSTHTIMRTLNISQKQTHLTNSTPTIMRTLSLVNHTTHSTGSSAYQLKISPFKRYRVLVVPTYYAEQTENDVMQFNKMDQRRYPSMYSNSVCRKEDLFSCSEYPHLSQIQLYRRRVG